MLKWLDIIDLHSNSFHDDNDISRHGIEPILPGMNFSPRQLFWLSSARVWCNAKRPGALKKQVCLSVFVC